MTFSSGVHGVGCKHLSPLDVLVSKRSEQLAGAPVLAVDAFLAFHATITAGAVDTLCRLRIG